MKQEEYSYVCDRRDNCLNITSLLHIPYATFFTAP